jgi:hypothetical protein
MDITKKMASLLSGKGNEDNDDEIQLVMEDYKNTKSKLSQAMKEIEALNSKIDQQNKDMYMCQTKCQQKDDIIECLINRNGDAAKYKLLFQIMKEKIIEQTKAMHSTSKSLRIAEKQIQSFSSKINQIIANREAKLIVKELTECSEPKIEDYQKAILLLKSHILYIQQNLLNANETKVTDSQQLHLPDLNKNRWAEIKNSLIEMDLIKETEFDWFDDTADEAAKTSPFTVKAETKSDSHDLPPQALGFLESKEQETSKDGWGDNDINLDEI